MPKKRLASSVMIAGLLTAMPLQTLYAARGDIQQLYQGQTIDDMVIHFMMENHIPGLSLAIVQAPYIPRVVGYGLAYTETKRLVSSNTIFDIGQITTGFTAIAIMQLVEEGKIKLTDPIGQYIPQLPNEWQSIT